jgi:hypothetical protein
VKHTKLGHEPYIVRSVTNLDNCFKSFLSRVYTSFVELQLMIIVDIMQSTSIHLLYVWSCLNFFRPRCFLWYCNITSMWRLLGFVVPHSYVQARRSTACLSISNCFPLRCRIACILPTHYELASASFNVLVAFLVLTTIVEHLFPDLVADFTVDNSLIVLRWIKCTS